MHNVAIRSTGCGHWQSHQAAQTPSPERGIPAVPKAIDAEVPIGHDIHLIKVNYGTHKTQAVRAWLATNPCYHVNFTPTFASWLNLVERFFSQIREQ